MQDESRDIPLDRLVEPRLVLRLVDRDSVEYMELRDSLAARGFLNSICVRPATRPDAVGKYEVVDGLYRYNCARDLSLPSMPCIIKHDLSDDDVLALQIQANAIRPETTPTDFARQLQKIMAHRPGLTMCALADIVHKNPQWVKNTLGLLTLPSAVQRAVDRGEIVLGNAYMLAKIPASYRNEFVEQAQTLPAKEFKALTAAFIKKYSEAVRKGKLEVLFTREFQPVAYVRSLKELQHEHLHREQAALWLTKAKCQSPVEAWYLALQWVLHLDEASVEQQRHAAQLREHREFTTSTETDDDDVTL